VKVWLDGHLVAGQDARVSVFDHGVTVGDGVFETIKVVDGTAFALTRHLNRLSESAAGLGLPKPDLEAVRGAVSETLAANAGDDVGRLRVTYTGGVSPLGSERGASGPTLIVAVGPGSHWPPSAALVTVPWPRNERSAVAGLKTTSYAENVVALSWAKERGGGEALYLDTQGRLCEGTGSNLFVVVDGRLMTPSLATGCLAGVTRALVIEWSNAEEFELDGSVLEKASEVFLTSTTRDVQPVHGVDARSFAAPGPITAEVQREFAVRSAADLDPRPRSSLFRKKVPDLR
jgi:branched-chain amino acid aminotransferase